MNQDPQNPINPATAAAPSLTPDPSLAMPSAPAMGTPVTPAGPIDAPTLDPSLLQQAINDVPEEAAETTPPVPSAVNLSNLGDATPAPAPISAPSMDPMMGANPMAAPAAPSPFATAAPAADFSAPAPEAPVDPSVDPNAAMNPAFAEAPKTTPSVAFNDPAQAPEKPGFKKPAFLDGKKINPVILIVGGGALIIIALVLILAFAV
ncbi:hypothetical protein IJH46_01325 [Candidatus Saccharibacteria bacterium]|nr:hypothetical protein [Candidatus Saccharibacteria bacterium]